MIQATRNRSASGLSCGVEYNSVSQRATGRQADVLDCRVHGIGSDASFDPGAARSAFGFALLY